MRMNRTLTASLTSRPKRATKLVGDGPLAEKKVDELDGLELVLQAQVPARWLRRSKMSAGWSGTPLVGRSVYLDDPYFFGERPGPEVSALQESEDGRVRGEDPIPVGVACHPGGGKEGRYGGRREERVDADVSSPGRERLEGAVDHVDRSNQQGRTVRSVERREALEVEVPDEERAQVRECRAGDVQGRKPGEEPELRRRRARGKAGQVPSLDETHEVDAVLVKGDFPRRLRGQVLPAGEDSVFDGRRVPVGLLQDARPRQRRGEGAAGRAAQADDLVPVLNAVAPNRALSAPATNAHWLPPPWQAIATRLRAIAPPPVERVYGGRHRACQPTLPVPLAGADACTLDDPGSAVHRPARRSAGRTLFANGRGLFVDGVTLLADDRLLLA